MGIARGVRHEKGSLEDSVGLLTMDIRERFAPALHDYAFAIHPELRRDFRFIMVPKKGNNRGYRKPHGEFKSEEEAKPRWLNATEYYLQIDVSYEDFTVNDQELLEVLQK